MNTSGFNKGPLAKTEACLIDSNQKIQNAIPVAKMDAEPSYKDIFSINDELLKENLPLRQINKKL